MIILKIHNWCQNFQFYSKRTTQIICLKIGHEESEWKPIATGFGVKLQLNGKSLASHPGPFWKLAKTKMSALNMTAQAYFWIKHMDYGQKHKVKISMHFWTQMESIKVGTVPWGSRHYKDTVSGSASNDLIGRQQRTSRREYGRVVHSALGRRRELGTGGPPLEGAARSPRQHLELFSDRVSEATGKLFGLGKRIKFRLNSSFLENFYNKWHSSNWKADFQHFLPFTVLPFSRKAVLWLRFSAGSVLASLSNILYAIRSQTPKCYIGKAWIRVLTTMWPH